LKEKNEITHLEKNMECMNGYSCLPICAKYIDEIDEGGLPSFIR
jgi:hypothetical protein